MKEISRAFSTELLARLGEEDVLIQAVLGPRQVGKTTGVKQVLAQIKAESLYVSADELIAPQAEWLLNQWQKAVSVSGDQLQQIAGAVARQGQCGSDQKLPVSARMRFFVSGS